MIDPSPHVLWGREHVDYDPLRLVLPEHEDYSAFSWIEAAPSPDTGALVHYYKRRFRGYLRFDHEGRVYRHSARGPRLIPGDRRITTLRAFVELFEDEPDILPGLIRLRYDDEDPPNCSHAPNSARPTIRVRGADGMPPQPARTAEDWHHERRRTSPTRAACTARRAPRT